MLGGKCEIKSWGTITCGQNLDVKELRNRTPNAVPKRNEMRASAVVTASTMMAQMPLWKQGQMSQRGVEKRRQLRVPFLLILRSRDVSRVIAGSKSINH